MKNTRILAACTLLLPVALWVAWGAWGAAYVADYWSSPERAATTERSKVRQSTAAAEKALRSASSSEPIDRGRSEEEASRLSQLGQVGDLFGGINALFAALAFGGVALAAFFQHRSLIELERQTSTQSKQAALQAFEPLFFRLLELHRDMGSNMELAVSGLDHNDASWEDSHKTLSAVLPILRSATIVRSWTPHLGSPEEQRKRMLIKPFRTLYKRNVNVLGPYFRTLYHLFKLIDKSGLPQETQRQYANIARATLSEGEVFLLMLDGASEFGEGLREYIHKFELLKHLPRNFKAPTHDELIADLLYGK